MSGLALGCTSHSSSEEAKASPDTTTTAVAATVDPASDPAAPTEREKTADERSVAQKIEDTSLETQVQQALVETADLRVFSFQPTVVNGHLILRGDVNTTEQYAKAKRVAAAVDGIKTVTNRLTMGGRVVTEERLAAKDENEGEDGAVYHTVRVGDTLWEIARRYQSSVRQIRDLNDFHTRSLRPGERIRVR